MTDTLIEAPGPVGRLREDGGRPRASTSASMPARSSRSSAPTAPARPPRCSPSPASCRRWRARSGSSARPPGADARALPERARLRHRGALGDHGHVGRRQPEARRRAPPEARSSYFPALERSWAAGPGSAPAASSRCSRWPAPSAASPKVLLADELSLGLAPIIVDQPAPGGARRGRRARRRRAARRAARPPGAQDRRPRLRDGARPDRAERHGRRGRRPARQDRGRLPHRRAPEAHRSRGPRSGRLGR